MNLEIARKLCQDIVDKNQSNKLKTARYAFEAQPDLVSFLKDKFGEGLKVTEYLYLCLFDDTQKCKRGNNKKFNTFYLGYRSCKQGCPCDRENKSLSQTEHQKKLSSHERERRNAAQRKTIQKKYGVNNVTEIPGVKDKMKATNLERYGVEFYSQTKEYNEKIRQTSLDKFGVEHFTQNEDVKNKVKQTNMILYGGSMVQARMAAEKMFGGNVFASEWFKDNRERFYMDAFGAPHPLKSEIIKQKMFQNNVSKYGFPNIMQKHYDTEWFDIFSNVEKLEDYILNKAGIYDLSEKLGCHISTLYKLCKRSGINVPSQSRSWYEAEIANLLKNHNIKFEQGNRRLLSTSEEIDFFIESHNVAIEFNGLWCHGENVKTRPITKFSHYNKWKEMTDKGITLLTIFEDEYLENPKIWHNKILLSCGKYKATSIRASKCEIRHVNSSIKNKFLDDNHIQGPDRSVLKYGLFYKNELVSVMTFSRHRDANNCLIRKNEIVLNRFCTKHDLKVHGAASKLLEFAKKELQEKGFNKITSFSDNRYATGNMYDTLGFNNDYNTGPEYSYFYKTCRFHKFNFSKSKIQKKFNIDPDIVAVKTEWELMQSLKFDRIWDCGKKHWTINI